VQRELLRAGGRRAAVSGRAAARRRRGARVGIHGWIHERNSTLPPDAERDLQMRSADTLERICGVRPVGIRTPSWDFSPHTLAITRDMGLLYDSSLMADVDCYELLLTARRPAWSSCRSNGSATTRCTST
jgi:peptidoglycan/xylan/chitin deacetylase (PgdA/CDA1 family)